MDKVKIREKAKKLRAQGKTYSEIQKDLKRTISKSTLSYWSRGISLPQSYFDRVQLLSAEGAARGRKIALVTNRVKRKRYLASLTKRSEYIAPLLKSKDVAKIGLSMLYLGEGAKWKGHRGLHLANSDPDIVRIYIMLLQKCYGIPKEKLRAKITYRADQNLTSLITFWSRVTGIPKHHFYKTIPDPRTVGKKTKRKEYRGVCAIVCGGTEIQLELDIIARMFLDS